MRTHQLTTALPSTPRPKAGNRALTDWYRAQSVGQRQEFSRVMLAELQAILSLRLSSATTSPDTIDQFIGQMMDLLEAGLAQEDQTYPASDTRRLIQFLSSDGQEPGRGFLWDLAEILVLPREQRREYTLNQLSVPPFDIRKLLLEYSLWSHKLDQLTGVLSKDFCAHSCDRLPEGCCIVLGYDMGITPDRMLAAQELEARRSGWTPPLRESKCRYHGPRGCVLRLFKTPACLGMLCEPLLADLRGRYSEQPVRDFLEHLARFRNLDLDREKIFRSMQQVVESGQALLGVR